MENSFSSAERELRTFRPGWEKAIHMKSFHHLLIPNVRRTKKIITTTTKITLTDVVPHTQKVTTTTTSKERTKNLKPLKEPERTP